MTAPSEMFDMDAAPMRLGTVTLKVRDLERLARYYRDILGLAQHDAGPARIVLGTADAPLLILEGDATLAPGDPRQAGLFHTAFLLPGRHDLGRWLAHAAASGVRLQGASDHIVSEALYLSDPEGNGIEVYADRPFGEWRTATGEVRMATDPLDLHELVRSAGTTSWQGFPKAGRIGHVHLQVGDTAAADRFYRDILGFDIAARYPGASFYGSGGYHHQLAGNVWNSRGAGPRPDDRTGLAEVALTLGDRRLLAGIADRATAAALRIEGSATRAALTDPWGTRLVLSTD